MKCFFCSGVKNLIPPEAFPKIGLTVTFTDAESRRLEKIAKSTKNPAVLIRICKYCLLERAIDPNNLEPAIH